MERQNFEVDGGSCSFMSMKKCKLHTPTRFHWIIVIINIQLSAFSRCLKLNRQQQTDNNLQDLLLLYLWSSGPMFLAFEMKWFLMVFCWTFTIVLALARDLFCLPPCSCLISLLKLDLNMGKNWTEEEACVCCISLWTWPFLSLPSYATLDSASGTISVVQTCISITIRGHVRRVAAIWCCDVVMSRLMETSGHCVTRDTWHVTRGC